VAFSALDAIPLAFQHTKEQLFTRFSLGQWTRLAFVGLLAGELGSGGGGGGNFNPGGFRHPEHPGMSPFPNLGPDVWPKVAALGAAIAVVIFAVLVLGLIFMYVSSVMRFILFDSVLAKECHIRLGWNRRQGPGSRLFLFKLAYSLVTFAAFVVLIAIPAAFAFAAGWFKAPKEHVVPIVLGGLFLAFVIVFLIIIAALVYVLTKDFVVPQMALENIGPIESWRRLWRMMGAEKAYYAGYIGMKILMAIAAGIVVGLVTLILGLLIAIPAVGLGILAVLTGQSAGLTWNAYTITLAILVGTGLLGIFFYIVSLVSVPVMVFFPAYSMYFFAARYTPLHAVLYPPPPSAAGAVPPLPPAPQPAG